MSLSLLVGVAGLAWFWWKRNPSPPPLPALTDPKPPERAVLGYVPGTTDIQWGPEIANAEANRIRLREGWSLRSLQA